MTLRAKVEAMLEEAPLHENFTFAAQLRHNVLTEVLALIDEEPPLITRAEAEAMFTGTWRDAQNVLDAIYGKGEQNGTD